MESTSEEERSEYYSIVHLFFLKDIARDKIVRGFVILC